MTTEANISLVMGYMHKRTEPVTAEEIAPIIEKSRATARDTLNLCVERGLMTKKLLWPKKFAGNVMIWLRTEKAYVPPAIIEVGKPDFSALLGAWNISLAPGLWGGEKFIHRMMDDERLGFGEFADGTCL